MDAEAARRARQRAIKADLAEAYSDEEACPPEWADLLAEIRQVGEALALRIADEARRFVDEPDVRVALARRERVDGEVRAEIERLNERVRRLNLIAPLARFHRSPLDGDELLRPLYRARRGYSR